MQKSNSALVISLSIVISVIVIVVVLTTTLLMLTKDSKSEQSQEINDIDHFSPLKDGPLQPESNASKTFDSEMTAKQMVQTKIPTFESEEIGAIFYCYKNEKATRHVLKTFRLFYPTGDIALLADGGLDFSYLKPLIPLTYYEYSKNLSVKWTKTSLAHQWLQRFHRGMQSIKNRWVVILEDDVEFRSRFKTMPSAAMSGGRVDENFLSSQLSNYLRHERRNLGIHVETSVHTMENGVLQYGFGGCGGCVIDRKWWMDNYDSKRIPKFLEVMMELDPQPHDDPEYPNHKVIHSDVLLSAIILYFGGNLQIHPEWAQDFIDKPFEHYAVFHNWKEEYPEDILKKKHTHQ